jgi:hypothetical protein
MRRFLTVALAAVLLAGVLPFQALAATAQVILFDLSGVTATYGDAALDITGHATGGGSGNPVTFSSLATGVCTTGGTNGELVTVLAAGACSIQADQAAGGEYDAAVPVTSTLTVGPATLTVTADGHTISFGQPDPAFTFTYGAFVSPDTSAVVTAAPTCGVSGPHASVSGSPYAITCSGGVAANYTFAFVDGVLTITTATPGISVTGGAFTYNGSPRAGSGFAHGVGGIGDVLSPAVTLSYTGTSGTTYGPTSTAPTAAGSYTVTASFAGNVDYAAASDTASLTIGKAAPACTVTGYNVTYTGSAHTATGACLGTDGTTALAGLVLSGTTHTSAGSWPTDPWSFTDVTGNYENDSGTVADAIAKATPGISVIGGSFPFDGSQHPGSGFASGVGGIGDVLSPAVTLEYAGTGATVYPSTPTAPTAAGSYTVTVSFAGNADYEAASDTASLTIGAGLQTISFSFASLPPKTYGNPAFSIVAYAGATSGLPVTFTALTPLVCTVSVSTVTIQGAGQCAIRATQGGNSNWSAALLQDRTFTVAKAAPACTVTGYSVTWNGAPHTATGSCLGVDGTTVLAGLSLSGTVHTAAGPYPTDPWTFTDVTGNYLDAFGTVADAIAKGPQVIGFTTTAPVSPSIGATYVPAATATSGLAVTLGVSPASASICTLSGGTVTFSAVGSCVITADQAGTADWSAAPTARQTVVVGDTAPSCLDAAAAVVMNVAASGGATCTDLEHNPLTYAIVANTAHGSASIDGQGSWTYVPAPDYTGPDTFTFTANDSLADSNIATVSLTVANQPIDARNDGFTVAPLAASTLPVLANDTPGPGNADAGQPLRIVAVTQGAKGLVATNGSTVTYDPRGCATGTDAFTYTVTDGQSSATKSVFMTIARPGQGGLSSAPVTDTPAAGIVAGSTMGSTIPTRISWCGVTRSGTSVRSYRVGQSSNGGRTYPATIVRDTRVTSIASNLSVGATYRWRARTVDSAGRVGGFALSPTVRIIRYQETSTAISYTGPWRSSTNASASSGTQRYTAAGGATATITLTGARQFAVVGPRSSTRGSFRVYVDGTLVATVTERASATAYRRILYVGGVTTGTHRIEIVASGNGRIDLDAVLALY